MEEVESGAGDRAEEVFEREEGGRADGEEDQRENSDAKKIEKRKRNSGGNY